MSNTKGPWVYRPAIFAGCFYIETEDKSHSNTFIGEVGGGLQHKVEVESNARLIAAAPRLLNACVEALKYHQGGHSEIGFILSAAIKEATLKQ